MFGYLNRQGRQSLWRVSKQNLSKPWFVYQLEPFEPRDAGERDRQRGAPMASRQIVVAFRAKPIVHLGLREPCHVVPVKLNYLRQSRRLIG